LKGVAVRRIRTYVKKTLENRCGIGPTAEVGLRLVGDDPARGWDGRSHFFGRRPPLCGTSWSNARRKQRKIHGGGRRGEDLPPDRVAARAPDEDLLALDSCDLGMILTALCHCIRSRSAYRTAITPPMIPPPITAPPRKPTMAPPL